jgi:hypothetical protein
MVLFPFNVNKTFVERTNHPITIPKKEYARLISNIYQGSDKKAIPLFFESPKGRILQGKIYYGNAGYGPYYQIRVKGDYPSDYFGNFKIGDTIWIAIKKSNETITVKIISPEELIGLGVQ